jgi:hypothetical protein
VTLKGIQPDDVVEVDIKGRRFRADVEHVEGAALRIRPLLRNISYRHASARQGRASLAAGGTPAPLSDPEPGRASNVARARRVRRRRSPGWWRGQRYGFLPAGHGDKHRTD